MPKRRGMWITDAIVIILLLVVLVQSTFLLGGDDFFIAMFNPPEKFNLDSLEINYDDLTEREIGKASLMVSRINEKYLIPQRSLTFTHDLQKWEEELGHTGTCKEIYPDTGCGGFNHKSGDVYVLWADYLEGVEMVFCHELLHSVIPTTSNDLKEDNNHAIVRDLGMERVCFD